MAAWLADVLTNLFASAAWDLVIQPGFRHVTAAHERPYAEAVAQVQATLAAECGELDQTDAQALGLFLTHPDVRTLVRTAYTSRAFASTASPDTLPATFAALWARRVPEDSLVALDPQVVFSALIDGCEAVIDTHVATGSLSAFDAREAARHNALKDQLDGLERQLALLTADDPVDLQSVEAFQAALQIAVGQELSQIEPPSFDGARSIAIDDLYVEPAFSVPRHLAGWEEPARRSSAFGYRSLLTRLDHMVIVGNPGAGKSTLTTKLCHDLATGAATVGGGTIVTPLRIELRKLGRAYSYRWPSIRDYLTRLAQDHYGLDVPAHAVEQLLLAGRLLVVFDGLDELPELDARRNARNQINAFIRRYPMSRVMVTSRETGYEHAALDGDRFTLVHLEDFDEARIVRYVQRWFALDRSLDKPQQEAKAAAFLTDSDEVTDLRSNPLMLALMCLFYRGNGYIPRNRPQVYERCATMLFEAWDRQRGMDPLLPIQEHLRPLLRALAFWFWSTPAVQAGAPEPQIVDRASRFLEEWRFKDKTRAEYSARRFLDFCRGRAWIFSILGKDEHEEPLFGFTHRTFLEFFAAEELVQQHEAPEDLAEALAPRLRQEEWELVAQLTVQLSSKRLGYVDRLLLALADHGSEDPPHVAAPIHAFIQRMLALVVPRPETIEQLTQSALATIADIVDASPEAAAAIARTMIQRDMETTDVVRDVLEAELLRWLSGDEVGLVELAAEIILFAWARRDDHGHGTISEGALVPPTLQQALMRAAQTDSAIALHLWWVNWLDADGLVTHANVEALFTPLSLRLRQLRLPSPIAYSLEAGNELLARSIVVAIQQEGLLTHGRLAAAAKGDATLSPLLRSASPYFGVAQESLWRAVAS